MEEYAKQLESFAQEDCNTRMWVIARETRIPLSTIRGYTAILQQIDIPQTKGLPENFEHVLERIADAEAKLSLVLRILATYNSPLHMQSPRNDEPVA
jgi:hypothetical protein